MILVNVSWLVFAELTQVLQALSADSRECPLAETFPVRSDDAIIISTAAELHSLEVPGVLDYPVYLDGFAIFARIILTRASTAVFDERVQIHSGTVRFRRLIAVSIVLRGGCRHWL